MSSIVYLADSDMLDYHRISGNRDANFWRIGVRNFDSFYPGDLLFFVDGSQRHPNHNEKGIVGFGVYKTKRTLTVNSTWERYKTKNGFETKNEFCNALKQLNNDILPEKIQSIELGKIIFFKAPIYLSEVGDPLNINLESYMYLDDDLSIKLLKKGYHLGIDNWFLMYHSELDSNDILKMIERVQIRSVLSSLEVDWTIEQKRLIRSYKKIDRVGNLGYIQNEKNIEIFIPVSSLKNQFLIVLGTVYYIEKKINKKCKFKIILREQTQSHNHFLKDFDIEIIYI